jgi:hypothetical protein
VTFTVTVQEPLAGIVPAESATLGPLFAAVTVPAPHVVAPRGVVVFVIPAGYVSVNAAPVSAVAFGLVIVIVRTEAELGDTLFGANAFAIVACCSTVSVAVAAAAVPAFVVVTLPVLLRYELALAEVTLTVTVQEPLAGIVPPESARLAPPLAAVTTPAPQVVAPEAEAVFTRPAGYESVNAAPVTASGFGFVSVIVITLVSFVPMEAGPKAFVTVSAEAMSSVPLAAARLAPALAVVSAPAPNVFVYEPGVAPVTFTVTVHEPLAGIVPPESATLAPPFAAVTTPPAHVVAPEADAVFTRPAG